MKQIQRSLCALLMVWSPACGSENASPTTLAHLDRTVASNAGGFELRWESSAEAPPLNEEYDFALSLAQPDGTPLDLPVDHLSLGASMPQHGHGMNQDPLIERTAPGHYLVRGMRLHMTGRWEVYVDVRQGPVTERAEFPLELE